MSLNREAVYWNTPDGTWSLGFWWFDFNGDPGEDGFDHEWDVTYSEDRFWFLTTGHDTPASALRAYRSEHPNPGFDLFDDDLTPGSTDGVEAEPTRWQEIATSFKSKYGREVEAYDHP